MDTSHIRWRGVPTATSNGTVQQGSGPDDLKPGNGPADVYTKLKLDHGSLRLISIDTAAHESDPVICALEVFRFKDKPRFEALSYTWGPEEPTDLITVNQARFKVRRNLFDALRFLRTRARATGKGAPVKHVWIDAICINQGDTIERSEQVRIMSQIYSRAGTVIVWLGTMNLDIESHLQSASRSSTNEHYEAGDMSLVESLRTNDYWNRAWVLQEISQAKSLTVCFGSSQEWPWNDFIDFVTWGHHMGSKGVLDVLWHVLVSLLTGYWFADRSRGPLKVDKLRNSKYTVSHGLKRLLEDHSGCNATDPRDKIYALVGFATDAVGFPIDYSKSPFEVWKDTMICLKRGQVVLNEGDIIPTGRLVKRMLMRDISSPLNRVLGEAGPMTEAERRRIIKQDHNNTGADVFKVRARILGMVVVAGTTVSDLATQPASAMKLASDLQRCFGVHDIAKARQECDRLIQSLLELDGPTMENTCCGRSSMVEWQVKSEVSVSSEMFSPMPYYAPKSLALGAQYQYQLGGGSEGNVPREPQVFATQNFYTHFPPALHLQRSRGESVVIPARRKMGIAPATVRLGDLVCEVEGATRALMLRISAEPKGPGHVRLRVIGTGLMMEDLARVVVRGNCSGWRHSYDSTLAELEIHVDAETVFMLADDLTNTSE